MSGWADLHAHTTASDGSVPPAELVREAARAGLSVLAVTDHDTTAGVAAAQAAAAGTGVRIIPGVELSTEGDPGKCHMLGLGIDPADPALIGTLASLSEARRTRNGRMIERFAAIGVPITEAEVAAYAPAGANLGRPHFAQALVARGAAATVQEAFDKFLAEGAAAYLPKDVLPPAQAISLIHGAGGIAVLAHPGLLKLADGETLRDRLVALKAIGLDGVEVYYPRHSAEQTAELAGIAADLDLLVTGGSDFHGTTKPDIRLGVFHEGHAFPLESLPPSLR